MGARIKQYEAMIVKEDDIVYYQREIGKLLNFDVILANECYF